MEKKIKETLQVISLISVTLVILSSLRAYLFYDKFSIKIYDYISSFEVISSLIPSIYTSFLVILTFLIMVIATTPLLWKKRKKEFDSELDKKKWQRYKIISLKRFVGKVLISYGVVLCLLAIIGERGVENIFIYRRQFMAGVCFFSAGICLQIANKFSFWVKTNFNLEYKTTMISFSVIVLTLLLILDTNLKVNAVKKNLDPFRFEFTTKDEKSYKWNSQLSFIGTTATAIFLFDLKSNRSIVLDKENIKDEIFFWQIERNISDVFLKIYEKRE